MSTLSDFQKAFRTISPLLFLIFLSQSAKASDWKYIGGTTYDGKYYYAFYDKQTEQRRGNGRFTSIWVKLVDYHELDSIRNACNDTLINLLASEVVKGRVPPYVLQSDSLTMVLMFETIVNQFRPKTRYMMHTELDCKEYKMRTLSLTVYDDFGDTISSGSDPEAKWSDVVPDTFGQFMMETMCRKRK